MVSGEMANVVSAVPQILGLLEETAGNAPTRVFKPVVPSSIVSSLIGKGGEIISQIRQATGTNMSVKQGIQGCPEQVVEITGNADAIVMAVQEMLTITMQ